MAIDWNQILEKYQADVLKGYEDYTMKDKISNFQFTSVEPVRTLMKYDHPPQAQILLPGQPYIDNNPVRFEPATAYNVGYRVDLSNVKEHIVDFNKMNYMYRLGSNIALREYISIGKSMEENAGQKIQIENDRFKREHIEEGSGCFTRGLFSEDMIIDRKSSLELIESDDFLTKGYLEHHGIPNPGGMYYMGRFRYINTFNSSFLEKKAILFDKKEIQVVTTDFEFSYDNPKNPTMFQVDKFSTSSPIVNDAVVVIELTK